MAHPAPKKSCKKIVSNLNPSFTRNPSSGRTRSVSTDDESGHGSGRPKRQQGKMPPCKINAPFLRQQSEESKKILLSNSAIKSKAIANKSKNKQLAVLSTMENTEKKVKSESTTRSSDVVAKQSHSVKSIKAKGNNSVGTYTKNQLSVGSEVSACSESSVTSIEWDNSVDNNNDGSRNLTEEDKQSAEEKFRMTMKKLQTPTLKKITTNLRYDDTCLSKNTRKVIDTDACKNEVLWLNPLFLDKRKNLITIPSETENRPSKAPVTIAKYIRSQQQLKLKPNRRHGEKYIYDKELKYRRIFHEKSFSLNMHTHKTGYDDDMGDYDVMQKQMTAQEKKLLGSYEAPIQPLEENREYISSMIPIRLIVSDSTTTTGQTGETNRMVEYSKNDTKASTSDGLFPYDTGTQSAREEILTTETEVSTPRDLEEISRKTNIETGEESDFIEKFFTGNGEIGATTTDKDYSGSEGMDTEIETKEVSPHKHPMTPSMNIDDVYLPFLYSTMDDYITFRNSVEITDDSSLDLDEDYTQQHFVDLIKKQSPHLSRTGTVTDGEETILSPRNDSAAKTSVQSAETVIYKENKSGNEGKCLTALVYDLGDKFAENHEDGNTSDFWDQTDDTANDPVILYHDIISNAKVNEVSTEVKESVEGGRSGTSIELEKAIDSNSGKSELKEMTVFTENPSVFFPSFIPVPDFTLKKNCSSANINHNLSNDPENARNHENPSFVDKSAEGKNLCYGYNSDHPDTFQYKVPDVDSFYFEVDKLCKGTNSYTLPHYTKARVHNNPVITDIDSLFSESQFPSAEVKIFQDMYNKYVKGSKEKSENSATVKDTVVKVHWGETEMSDSMCTIFSETNNSDFCNDDISNEDTNQGVQDSSYKDGESQEKHIYGKTDETSKSLPLPVIEEESECEVEFEEPTITKSWLYNLIFSAGNFDDVEPVYTQPEEIEKTPFTQENQQNVIFIDNYDATDSCDQSSGFLGSPSDNLTAEETDIDDPVWNYESLMNVNKMSINMTPAITTNFLTLATGFLNDATEKCGTKSENVYENNANTDLNFFKSLFLSQYNELHTSSSCCIEELPNSSAEEHDESYVVESPSEIALKHDAPSATETRVEEIAAEKQSFSDDKSITQLITQQKFLNENFANDTVSETVDTDNFANDTVSATVETDNFANDTVSETVATDNYANDTETVATDNFDTEPSSSQNKSRSHVTSPILVGSNKSLSNENLDLHLTSTSSEYFTIEPTYSENCIQTIDAANLSISQEDVIQLVVDNKKSSNKQFEGSLSNERFDKETSNKNVGTTKSISKNDILLCLKRLVVSDIIVPASSNFCRPFLVDKVQSFNLVNSAESPNAILEEGPVNRKNEDQFHTYQEKLAVSGSIPGSGHKERKLPDSTIDKLQITSNKNVGITKSVSKNEVCLQEIFNKNFEIDSTISNENCSSEMFPSSGYEQSSKVQSENLHSLGVSNSSNKFKKRKKTFSSRFVQQVYKKLRGLKSSLSRMMRDMRKFFRGTSAIKRKKSQRASVSQSVGESIFHHAISVIKNPPTTAFPTFSEFNLHNQRHKSNKHAQNK